MLIKAARQEDIEAVEKALSATEAAPVVADIRRAGPSGLVEITVFYPDREISIDDCSAVARMLAEDPGILKVFGADVMLSVASPGLGRKLVTDRELRVFNGREVIAAWRDAQTRSEHEEVCVLKSSDNRLLRVQTADARTMEIEWNEVRSIRLAEPK